MLQLLGWMHRKAKQNSNESAKNIILENSATSFSAGTLFEEQEYYGEANYSFTISKQPACKEVKSTETEMALEKLFHGFLSIGTLGSQTIKSDPPTPTFPMHLEHVIHGEVKLDIKENELKRINDELEKFVEAEVAHESSERSSHASIITLSGGKQLIEEVELPETYGNSVQFPLQKYLFGSSVELSETEVEGKKPKGELLIKRNNIAGEHHIGKDGKEKKQTKGRRAMHFMKKMLKNLHSKSKSSTDPSSGDVNEYVSRKRKLPQVLKMLKRKVHPAEGLTDKNKPLKDEIRKISCEAGKLGANGELNKMFSNTSVPTKILHASEVYPSDMEYDVSAVNREHWIKTDADYLVLEL
ncbi:protein LAZY 1-like isoform X1 [Nicotiana sylvestris]|uniref:Uncharacterized protein LOC104222269 isoform X1 n=1 Tax=Nicotiana sylvestris TaxID=4096 RepID=A0A1U7WC35_NICSY|nr:PREDICTED: uncharacterized protein LOC104222269 isoform X1 [Nicotiana sylvestris]